MANLNNLDVYGSLFVTGSVEGLPKNANIRVLTNTSTTVFTPSSTSVIGGLVILTGGGGGGGSADGDGSSAGGGGGGGAGGSVIFKCTYAELNGATYARGSGGFGGVSGSNGFNGGNTVFTPVGKSIQTAPGGVGGTGTGIVSTVGKFNGGAGGIPTNSSAINIPGGSGRCGWSMLAASGVVAYGGKGGSSIWSHNEGNDIIVTTSFPFAPDGSPGYGTGGLGGVCINSTLESDGGAGASGIVLVVEFLS